MASQSYQGTRASRCARGGAHGQEDRRHAQPEEEAEVLLVEEREGQRVMDLGGPRAPTTVSAISSPRSSARAGPVNARNFAMTSVTRGSVQHGPGPLG